MAGHMASSKVVRVGQVYGPPGGKSVNPKFVPAFDRLDTNRTDTTLLAIGTNTPSVLPYSRLDDTFALDDIDADLEMVVEEEKDKVYPLPENWPKLPQIFRRRSCELTKSTSPCINKAVSHLELLQNIIEDWCKDEEQGKSRQRTHLSSKRELRFITTREAPTKTSASSRHTSSSESSKPLSIHGVGFKDEKPAPVEGSVPYLGAEDAIEEVMTLLARLENDRQETELALERERERVVRLCDKIDYHCKRRMDELPAVVQKEHEECIMDLNELQWHVQYSSRNEERIQGRVDIAQVLNERLKEDIEFVKKHIPLVAEKLELELEAMEKIRNAQTDTNQELDNTKSRQEKTQSKSSEATQKAEKERGHIKKELDTVREALSSVNEELSEAKMTFNAYIHQINDIEQQLKDNEQELKVLEVKNENAKVAEEMQTAKVRDVQGKIEDTEYEQGRLGAENAQLQAEYQSKKSQYAKVIGELELAIKGRDNRLRRVVLKNQEVEMEVQDIMDKVTDCKQQKVRDEKNVARIHKESAKIEQQMSVTQEEFSRVQTLNLAIRDQLVSEQDKTFKMEESLKVTADTLKRQVKDEVHTKHVLTSRISSDSNDLTKASVEIKEKKTKYHYGRKGRRVHLGGISYDEAEYEDDDMVTVYKDRGSPATKVADDVVKAVTSVREKVEKLRSAKTQKSKRKEQLSAQREETVKQMAESEKRFEERIKQIEPHHAHLKEDLLNVNKRLDHIEWKSDVMRNKMEDMDKSQGMMDRLVNNTGKSIVTLQDQLDELNIQIDAARKLMEDLKVQYDDILTRVRNNQADHRKFMDQRKSVNKELENEKNRSIGSNKEHASKYRTLQNHHMVIKDKLMNNFEDRVKMENAIKDVRELQSLQIRMNGAMMEYYKYRGLYNTAELSRMEDLSISNSKKVSKLQDNMDNALRNISQFLQTEMTGDNARKMAWEAVKKKEERAARKEQRKLAEMSKTASTIEVA